MVTGVTGCEYFMTRGRVLGCSNRNLSTREMDDDGVTLGQRDFVNCADILIVNNVSEVVRTISKSSAYQHKWFIDSQCISCAINFTF